MTDIGKRTQSALQEYTDGIIVESELKLLLHEIINGTTIPAPKSAPSERTCLKHQTRYLNKEIRKVRRLLTQRAKVENLKKKLDDLKFEVQHPNRDVFIP